MLYRVAVRDGAQHMDTGKVDTGQRWRAGASTSAQHHVVVADALTSLQPDFFGIGVDTRHRGSPAQLDLIGVVPVRRPHKPGVERFLGAQVGLGQRRTTEWERLLVTEKDEQATKTLCAQLDCGVGTCKSRTHDHDAATAGRLGQFGGDPTSVVATLAMPATNAQLRGDTGPSGSTCTLTPARCSAPSRIPA